MGGGKVIYPCLLSAIGARQTPEKSAGVCWVQSYVLRLSGLDRTKSDFAHFSGYRVFKHQRLPEYAGLLS
jgi:hypothetical protein